MPAFTAVEAVPRGGARRRPSTPAAAVSPLTLGTLGGSVGIVSRPKKAGRVWHPLAATCPAGGWLTGPGAIDGSTLCLMRTQRPAHIVRRDSAITAPMTGGDMEPLKGAMDYEFENLTTELVGVTRSRT